MPKHIIFLIHGYTATKSYMQPFADHLISLNYAVHNASIAGHDVEENQSTDDLFPTQEFMDTNFEDWFSSVEKQFLECVENDNKITLIGHSMGGVISLKLAELYPQHIHALVPLAAPVYMNSLYPLELRVKPMPLILLLHPLIKKAPKVKNPPQNTPEFYNYPPQLASLFKNIDIVRNNLSKIHAPTLIIQAFDDQNVPDGCPLEIARKISSAHKLIKYYTIHDPKSNKHNILFHQEVKDLVYRDILEFLESQEVQKKSLL